MSDKKAFRCKKCGFLDHADSAGEHCHPHACRVCGSGVTFKHHELAERLRAGNLTAAAVLQIANELQTLDPAAKTLHPDNWEVLADCSHDRLAELGLAPEHVEKHEPWPSKTDGTRPPRLVAVHANEAVSQTGDAAGKHQKGTT